MNYTNINQNEEKTMIHSDAPITNEKEDELNRMPFVQQLSESICKYQPEDCLTIGLMGEWGCGKSSIINLMFKEIEKQQKDWIFVKFDPWYFSNHDNLILQFFNTIFNELEFKDKLNRKSKELVKNFINGLSLNLNAQVVYASLDFDKLLSNENYQKFTDFKNDLDNIFSKLPYKIIVSIDNIDRLTNDEINQILVMVKSLADFPNLIYILSFDSQVVINSLNELKVYSPENFLKKIIQVPITVPQITESNLEILMHKYIEPVYDEYVKTENRFLDNGFWELLIYLKPFLNNIRDLKRYVNILNFYCEGFINDINIIDFMLILALQTFQNDAYRKIKNNKELLTQYLEDELPNYQKILGELFKTIKESFNNFDENYIDILLVYLFPVLSEVFGETLRRRYILKDDFRICKTDNFDKYFTLSLEESEVSDFYINSIKNLEVDNLTKEFIKLRDDEKLNSFLDKLHKKIGDFDIECSKNFINAFFKVADEFFNEFNMYNTKVNLILNEAFNNIPLNHDCFKILDDALNESKNLFTIIEFIYGIGFDYGRYSSKDNESQKDLCITENQFEKLERKAYGKIKEMEKNGELINNNYLSVLLKYWEDIENKKEVIAFVNLNTENNHDLIKFIYKFRRSHKYYLNESKEYSYDFSKLKRYFDLKKLNDRLESSISTDDLDDFEKEVCSHFLLKYKN